MNYTESSFSSDEFSDFFRKDREHFIWIATGFVRDKAVAEDIVSDSFVAFWEKRNDLPAGSNIRAYLMAIIRNRCLNWLRAQKIHALANEKIHSRQLNMLETNISSLESCDPKFLFENEINEIVTKELAKMTPVRRDLFIEVKFNNKSIGEAAQKFKVTYRFAEYHLGRATLSLRSVLKDYLPTVLLLLTTGFLQ